MGFDLMKDAAQRVLIVAHRGTFGGNIPCNTIPAYEIALKQGADMIEIDVEMSADGKLFIFHPGMEPHHLCHQEYLCNMTADEIAKLRYVNYDRTPTQFGVETFDDVMETFKGRCYINVDKFWGHPKEIYEAIKRHNMTDQILVKSAPTKEVFDVLEEVAPDLPFLTLVRDEHPLHEQLMKAKFNYMGAEVLFEEENAPVASEEFIDRMHKDGKLLWVNSIIYDYNCQLTARHSDDSALCQDFETGWGWLARRGFDFIQTDWPGMMREYYEKAGLLYKRGKR